MAALIPSASATGSGTMTLAGPSTNSNQTITIPDSSGSMMVSGNMPAFSAYGNAIQTLTNNVRTKVAYNTSVFDTNSNYSTTNARFTPTVAGYYQINFDLNMSLSLVSQLVVEFSKTGSLYQTIMVKYNGGAAIVTNPVENFAGTTLMYMNGSTDYVEIFVTVSTSGTTTVNGYSARPDVNFFNGVLVRTA
jgi:hypothetical protein